ncbi:complement receptor type 1 isoform X1 [Haplochromis burtoni]|uniref:Complement receptor type 1-like n=1 Tax=Haplochromis burtoni TaxID=8153 RepID=A0A3Q2WIQ1_HAPBU|nr:complement receptor type 1 isoform X1 [Haplochromis burtoni]
MRTVGWSILVFLLASPASGQVSQDCSAPDKYPNTKLETKYARRQKFSHSEKVYYSCDDDFTAFRGSRAVQCVDGQWTKLTLKCEKISCGNAGDLPNGEFQYEGNSYIGEKVFAVCNEGYTLKGLNYMICKRSGWAGEFPSCEEGGITCPTPEVANSVQRTGGVSAYQVGDNLTFTCSEGFQLNGAQQTTCDASGQWKPQPPQCVPIPDDKIQPSPAGSCGVPPAVSNSNVHLADRFITKTSFFSGQKVYYNCDVGYVAAGGRKSRLCNNGKWTPLRLKCERKLCGSAGDIQSGQFVYTGVEFGDTATAVCDEGFMLVGSATRHCMNNGWSGRNPVCEAAVCEDPPEVSNAEITGLQHEPYTYKSVIRYSCRAGTLVGEREIWCTKHGTWSAPAPECKEITCPSPNVPNAYWTGNHNQKFQYRATIYIQCNMGYVMSGPGTVYCERDGRWLPELPKCQRRRFVNQWG